MHTARGEVLGSRSLWNQDQELGFWAKCSLRTPAHLYIEVTLKQFMTLRRQTNKSIDGLPRRQESQTFLIKSICHYPKRANSMKTLMLPTVLYGSETWTLIFAQWFSSRHNLYPTMREATVGRTVSSQRLQEATGAGSYSHSPVLPTRCVRTLGSTPWGWSRPSSCSWANQSNLWWAELGLCISLHNRVCITMQT